MNAVRWSALVAAALLAGTSAGSGPASAGASPQPTTAWRDGSLRVDTADLVSRSDLVLEGPSWKSYQSMPLGNGVLGAAVWAEKGYTAQLNRVDTFPDLKSAGQLVVPGLDQLMRAQDYSGRLRLHDADLVQRGGGMSARSYVRADADQFVLDVTGADPSKPQTALLKLWEGRSPVVSAAGSVAALAETFAAPGTTTGAVAAMTAQARDVAAEVVDAHTVRLTFRPRPDGSFQIVVGVPSYTGGDVATAAAAAVAQTGTDKAHLAWWHAFWAKAAPMRITSADGSGEYLENLRALQLYTTAASMRSALPSSHGAVIRMFSSARDQADWSQDSYWHFNLRMQVYANLGADTASFNAPYFRLYLDHEQRLRNETRENWPEAKGICIPEYMRFDGDAGACDSSSEPSWLVRILTSGPELVQNIWWQYRYTGDKALLDRSYPLMRDIAEFYLSVLKPGADGYLHLEHVNALEVQWDTTDPTPDLAAMRTFFPLMADLAKQHGDTSLASRLAAAVPKIPPFRTIERGGEQVLAWSGTDEAAHNTQNPEMEALWPWGAFDETSDLMQATYRQRVYPQDKDWGMDGTWAARLGLADEVRRLLMKGVQDFQIYPNGFTVHRANREAVRERSYYNEWGGVATSALQEALVQAYDGTVHVAPAWPADWDVVGAVQIEGGHRISTEVSGGVPQLVGIQAGSTENLRVRNPWPGQEIRVLQDDRVVAGPTSEAVVEVPVRANHSYVVERIAQPAASYEFAPLGGEPAGAVKTLGTRTLGVRWSEPPLRSDLVSVITPDKLQELVRARVGAQYYVDRSYTVRDLPAALENQALVPGANNDSKLTGPADYLTLDITRPATVYVAFDPRGEGTWWPSWLTQGFSRTDQTVGTTDQRLILFRKDVEPGRLELGANSGITGMGNSTYITFVTPR